MPSPSNELKKWKSMTFGFSNPSAIINPSLLYEQVLLMQNLGTIATIIVGIFSLLLQRKQISELYNEVVTKMGDTSGRLSNLFPLVLSGIKILIAAIFLFLIAIFILITPFVLYAELIQHQPLYINSFLVDSNSVIYGLVLIVWCLSIQILRHRFVIDDLRAKIDYLNRLPGIKEFKNKYNKDLLDSATRQWNDFKTELANNYDDSPFAIDLALCSIIDVQDETLLIGCPNKVICNRMNLSSPNNAINNSENIEKINDKKKIEGIVKKRFQVIRISYTIKKQIKT
jgi:hypothetical protein